MNSQPVFTAFCIYKGSNTYIPKTSDTPNTLSTSNVSAADAAKSCQIEANQNGTSRSMTKAMKLDDYNLWLQAQCVQIALVGRVTSCSFRRGALQGIMGRGGTQRAASLAYHKDLRISKNMFGPSTYRLCFGPSWTTSEIAGRVGLTLSAHAKLFVPAKSRFTVFMRRGKRGNCLSIFGRKSALDKKGGGQV
jgi:hypothetical protein